MAFDPAINIAGRMDNIKVEVGTGTLSSGSAVVPTQLQRVVGCVVSPTASIGAGDGLYVTISGTT